MSDKRWQSAKLLRLANVRYRQGWSDKKLDISQGGDSIKIIIVNKSILNNLFGEN